MTPQGNGLFNTSGAGEWFRRFRLGKRKAFARARRATARRAIPTLTPLEQRHLLSFTATWIGQNGSDFVGTVARSPNDYQDVVIHLSGLKTTVSEIYVQRYGGGAWDYKPSSSTNAFFQASSGNPEQGDLYLEPYFNDPTNYWYELIRVFYVDGSKEDYTTLHSGTPVDANLRVPGRGLSAQWLGQDRQRLDRERPFSRPRRHPGFPLEGVQHLGGGDREQPGAHRQPGHRVGPLLAVWDEPARLLERRTPEPGDLGRHGHGGLLRQSQPQPEQRRAPDSGNSPTRTRTEAARQTPCRSRRALRWPISIPR